MIEQPVGQDAEVGALEAFLDAIRMGPETLVVEGDVGAGKTTLWRAGVASARAHGYRVLVSRPTEAESSLAFAGLGDLLRDSLETTPTLPSPQAHALRVAVLLEQPHGPPPDQLAVSVATLRLLRAFATEAPVLLAVDDYDLLDPATARVLAFALRRLETERIGVLGAIRRNEHGIPSTLFDEVATGRPAQRVVPAPLAVDALAPLLRAELQLAFPRPLLAEIASASGGNPLFALEIARAIERGEIVPEPGLRLPVPRSLQGLLASRLADLGAAVRELLLVAAAVPDPTFGLLARVASPAEARDAVETAVEAGVIELRDDRIRFRHPLFASTVYHSLAADRRRALHDELARLVEGAHERARHLSLAADGPDASVAAALDEAAEAAARQGAPSVAAGLSEQARRLTPPDGVADGERRCVAAADYHLAAGDIGRARELLEDVVSALPAGRERADALRRLATVRYRQDSPAVAAELLTRAFDEAGDDVALRAGIERDLAWAVTVCGDVRDAAAHSRAALDLIEEESHPELRAELLAADAMAAFLLGSGLDRDVMDRSLALEGTRREVPVEWRPSMMLASMLRWSGDLDGAQRALEDLRARTVDAGDEASLPYLLAQLSETELLAGIWQQARAHAETAEEMAAQVGQDPTRADVLYAHALVAAHLGLVDEARASARAGLALAQQVGSVLSMLLNQTVLGFLELSLDDAVTAHEWLRPLRRWVDVIGLRDPGILRFVPDEAEALVALGGLDEAATLLDWYEGDARRLDRPVALLAVARARAMLCSAAGDAAGGAAIVDRALRDDRVRSHPFDRARAQFVLGTVLRRTRRRRAARTALEEALTTFRELGAELWSAKAERMLGQANEQPEHAILGPLTPAERRVAEIVAAGTTNRAAADRLFVSVRAVEVHLTSIYRKLGIRSRTELAGLLARPAPVERTAAATTTAAALTVHEAVDG